MFGKVATFEFRYQMRQPVFWVVALLFGLLSFFSVAASGVLELGFGANVHKNAPFAISETHQLFGLLYMFVTTAFVANVIVRDEDTGFGPLIRTTRISRFDYLFGRFLGAFGAAVISFAAVPLGLLLGSVMFWLDRETLGPVNLGHYAYAFFVLGVPSLFVTSAIFFTLATVTRSMMWTYVGVVGFLVFYFARGMALNALDMRWLGALLDPTGWAAFGQATRYWTVAEMNGGNPPVEGLLLWNKLLWIGVAGLILASSYLLFRFNTGQLRGRRLRQARLAARAAVTDAPPLAGPLPKPRFQRSTALAQLWARTRLDMRQVFLSPAYFVLLIIGAAFAGFALWTVTNLNGYGGEIFPVTRVLLTRLTTSFTAFPLIIALYYAGELVWREREKKVAELVDASAAPGWAFVLPKILAIALVLISTLLVGVVIALIIQTLKGYYNYELGKYLLWLVVPNAIDFTLIAVLAVFFQVVSPNKYVGWALMVIYMIAQGTAVSAGFEHNLYNYASAPGVPLSDMNGQGKFWIGALWFRLYWICFAVVLAALSHALWQRGADARLWPRLRALPRRLRGPTGGVVSIALTLFAATGCWIYYNTNVLNEYRTSKSEDRWRADYETALIKYVDTPRPKIVSMKLDVDIRPHEPKLTTRGAYVVENRTGQSLKEIHLAFDRDLKIEALAVERGRAKRTPYDRFNYRIFALDDPMLAGERRTITFTTVREQQGFRNAGDETRIVDNGTFVDSSEFAPVLGMELRGLLQDRAKRRTLLPKMPEERRMPPLDDERSKQVNYLRHDADFVMADITVTTDADQTPIAPGYKVSESVSGGRRTARFVTESPVMPFFSIQSAKYKIARETYKGVEIAVYHDPAHPWNVDRMTKAAKASLDYYQANFSPYQFRQLRFQEFPDYASFAQAFANTMPWSEGLGFIADYSDPTKIDMVTYIGAHEIGHQWWAHQIIGADQQGSTSLSETLAQYSALMVMKRMYGEDQIRKFLKFELDSYLRSRGGEVLEEQPLYKVENQGYVHYRKGSLVMYRLQHEIGEEAVNRALRTLLARFAFKGAPYPTSRDLVSALRAEAPADKQELITDLFERITLYDLQTKSVTVKKRADGRFDVTMVVSARKMEATGKGDEKDLKMDEVLDFGFFTVQPGKRTFGADKVIGFEKRRIRSGTQTLRFVLDKAPVFAGVDPYVYLIDRNAEDNTVKAGA